MGEGIEFSAANARALSSLILERQGDYEAIRLRPVQIDNTRGLKISLLCDSQRDGKYENHYLAIGGEVVRA